MPLKRDRLMKPIAQQQVARAHAQAYDPAVRRHLRLLSEQLTGLYCKSSTSVE
jgi:hypothetical protein